MKISINCLATEEVYQRQKESVQSLISDTEVVQDILKSILWKHHSLRTPPPRASQSLDVEMMTES